MNNAFIQQANNRNRVPNKNPSHDEFRKEVEFKFQPFTNITLILTDKCNLRCSYCYEHLQPNAGNKVMTWETAKKGLDLFYSQVDPRMQYTSISLFGGEPHMAFDVLKKAVDYTIDHPTISGYKGPKFNYCLNTNGTILTHEMFDLYSKLGKKINIRLSIDGFKENHDVTRKTIAGDGSWRMLEKNLEKYLMLRDQYGVQLSVVTTISTANCRDIYYNYTNIYELTGITHMGALYVHEDPWTDEDFDSIIEQVSQLYDYCQMNKISFPICMLSPDQSDPIHICSAGISSFTLDYKGDIYPCHRCYFYKIGNFYRMGDINTGISKSKRRIMYDINNMRNMPQKCKECNSTIKAKCHICFATNTVAYKDPYHISHKFCSFQRQLYYMLIEKWREYHRTLNVVQSSENSFEPFN